jgi:hypothetical protein
VDKDSLENIRIAFEESQKQYEEKNDAWWNGLDEKQREDAFYAVCKRIHRGDVELNGTYRYVLYDVFGFDPGMYMQGMNCGYFDIHNALFDADELQKMKGVNRFEVIDETGRVYSKWLDSSKGIKYNLQDEDRTLKVFIDKIT